MGLSSVEKNRVQRVDNKRDWAVLGGQGGLTEMAMLQREPEASEGRSHVDTGVEVGRALHAEGTTSAAALGEGSILVSSRKCGWNGSNQSRAEEMRLEGMVGVEGEVLIVGNPVHRMTLASNLSDMGSHWRIFSSEVML